MWLFVFEKKLIFPAHTEIPTHCGPITLTLTTLIVKIPSTDIQIMQLEKWKSTNSVHSISLERKFAN